VTEKIDIEKTLMPGNVNTSPAGRGPATLILVVEHGDAET
jgi:hypothetical protein